MTYQIHLRDTRDGHTSIYDAEYCTDDEGVIYYCTTGNFECDCNRALAMYKTETLPCNAHENVIELIKIMDGDRVVYVV